VIEARRPDLIVVDKKMRACIIVDVAVPGDCRVHDKEKEKVEKYQELKREIKRLWSLRKVQVVPIVVGALGRVSKSIEMSVGAVQKSALLGTARILRKVLEM